MNVLPLEKAIFRTLAYFAYFEFPLTLHEVYVWLLAPEFPVTYPEVVACIEHSVWLHAHSDRYRGYISLKECEAWLEKREARYLDAQMKHPKAQRAARLLMHVPGIQAIAICNSLAWHATTKKSDIDFFIVTRPGMVWQARLFAALPLKILRMRPGETLLHPLCLSFFADETALSFEVLREGGEDWYLPYWIASLSWIGTHDAVLKKMVESNLWVKNVLPHALPTARVRAYTVQKTWSFPLWFPEKWARRIQERILPQALRAQANTSTHVVLNDYMLKFHEHDRRENISAFVRFHMQRVGL